MKGRGGSGGGPAADLLVCFPARAHLALMPKPICSPSRSTDAPKRHHPSRTAARGQASPLFRTKARNATVRGPPAAAEVISEPTSPKVTCAGQIKVSRPKAKPPTSSSGGSGGDGKSWLAVMEEMEGLRRRQRRGRGHWLEALGLKKDAMHLLHALRGLRLHMRCFGSFRGPAAGCTSDEEDDSAAEEEGEDEEGKGGDAPQTIFSKWFMLLEESPSGGSLKRKVKLDEEEGEEDDQEEEGEEDEDREGAFGGCLVTPASPSTSSSAPPPPPPNALLLMRCRSAPAKGWLSNGGTGVDGGAAGGSEGEVTTMKIREDEKEKERLVLMSYAPDFFKVSPDIAKETWLVGSLDPLSRSRSWKR